MTSVRLALCAAAALSLLAPVSALAQGPHQAAAGAPCWTEDHAVKCLRDKLDQDVAQHRVGPRKAAALRHRLHVAERLETQFRDMVRDIDQAVPEPKE